MLSERCYINDIIKAAGKLSVNIVDEGMLPEADYVGSASGAKVDKSGVFEFETGEAETPIIEKAPLTMECTVVDVYETKGFESFICMIDNTYVEEEHLNEDGKINYQTLKTPLSNIFITPNLFVYIKYHIFTSKSIFFCLLW